MPRLSSQHSPMQHQPLRGADTPRRRRRPTGPRALTLLAGGEWRHVHGVRLPAGLRERGGRRSILRRDGHPTQVHWINGWPSIWTRLSVSKTFAVGDPEVGSTLAIGFRNTGVAGSTAAFDLVSLTSQVAESPPSPPPSPPPFPSPFPVTTTASPPPEASLPPACDDGGGGDIGAIADGVGGGVAAVALISVAVWNYAKLCQDDYYIGAPVCRLKRFGAARSVVLCLDHFPGMSVACPLYGLPPQLAMLLTLAASVAGGAACTPGSSCCVRHPRAASCSPSKSSPSKSRTTQLTRSPRKETPQDGKHTTCGWASGCCRRKPTECRDASHLRIAPTPSHTHCSPGDGGGAPCCAGTPVHMRIGKTGTKSITMSKPSRLSLRPAGSPEASLSAKA